MGNQELFKALADPTRRDVLRLLRGGSHTAGELAESFPMTRASLTHHFNVRGEPVVCTPEDAFRCFMAIGMDTLAVGRCYLRKEAQTASTVDYLAEFDPD